MNLHQRVKLIGIRESAHELADEISLIMGMDRPGILLDEAALRNAEERALNAAHDIASRLGFKLTPLRSEQFEGSEVSRIAAE